MISKLYENFNYTIKTNYIISSFIREYDIRKANINILLFYNRITKEQYDELYKLDQIDKRQREIQIGLLQKRDKSIVETLKNGFIEFRKQFFVSNEIQNEDVLSIKNDAIFLLNKIPTYTKFNNIEFINKNIYTSFYRLERLELYYLYDRVHDIEKLDIKGINNKKLKIHENYFLEFLKVVFCSAETESIKDTLDIIKTFYNKYINLELEKEYYIEFNQYSMYTLKSYFNYYSEKFRVPNISKNQLREVDITYNLNLIRELYKIFSNVYFSIR